MSLGLVSFDLDGTLLDTAGEIAEAANRTLESMGLERRPPAEIRLLIGQGMQELMRRLLALVRSDASGGERLTDDALHARFEAHYAEVIGTDSPPFAGAHAAIAALQAHGVRLACVTNKELRFARRLLEHHRLLPSFELVVGGDTLPHKKPHPSVLHHVADALGVARDAMAHVGDSAADVAAARAAGVRAWAVPYGYNAGRPITEARPDAVFPDLLAVAEAAIAIVPAPRFAAT
jgi:phosphoglycolate phosphatase